MPKKVAGENSMQIGPNFPAKYILHQFLLIPFHKLIEKYLINWLVVEENLKQIKYFEYKTFVVYWEYIER